MTTAVCILGCTGSIGQNTLDVLSRHGDRFTVKALAAQSDVQGMLALCRKWRPEYVAMGDVAAADSLRGLLADDLPGISVLPGAGGVSELAALPDCDIVVHGITGAAGLQPAMAALAAGKRLLLANKESLVMAGDLMLATAKAHNAIILPLDSEHNAALQCLPRSYTDSDIESLTLTASGGGLRDVAVADLAAVTPQQACVHPNWSMGAKITVDSATMMNKGLEVIEACKLFSLPLGKVRVLVHPQSIVHAMVQYRDGSALAHLAWPDMRAPIAYALFWPDARADSGVAALDLAKVATLDFAEPDYQRYPCLRLARLAMDAGGAAPIVLNAANEVAVQAFLSGKIAFTGIADLVAASMDKCTPHMDGDITSIMAADAEARTTAQALLP